MVQARVIVLPGGKLQIFIDQGTDKEAEEATKKILAKLKTDGINFESIGDIELHRAGGEHAHVVNEVHHEL